MVFSSACFQEYFPSDANSRNQYYCFICCDENIFVTSLFDTNIFSDFIPSCNISSLETEPTANTELLLSISLKRFPPYQTFPYLPLSRFVPSELFSHTDCSSLQDFFLLHYSFLLRCNFPDLFQILSWTILFCKEIIILVQRTLRFTYFLFRIFLHPCFTLKTWKLPIYTSVCNYAGKTNDVWTLA